ncbi:MAG: RsmB/NOP family class I SAM-dependent RNA methyltransferase [Candidatus Bathyarchaeota archaeon]|nr:RsmB/NOP family class I SAM-dependent RNA methyltransferase [Candidatus Bathyarchaeota archaeon]
MKDAWTVAIETLSWIEMQKLSERLALTRTVKQLNIGNADAIRYGYGLVCETVRRKNLIDSFINSVLKPKTLSELTLGVQAFLRLYVYQTRITTQWAKTDIEEAAGIAKLARAILGWGTLSEVEPFLGLLLTQKPELELRGASDEKRVAMKTFHPVWFVKYCFKLLGRREALAFLEGSMNPPPTYIRLNTLRASEEEILEELANENVKLEKSEPLKHAYKVTAIKHALTRTSSFQKGLFYIQDKASCYAAEAANPKPEMTVMDVCAAPGAKTTYIAQLMRNKGEIYSVDYSIRRIRTWQKETSRMGVEITEPILADARSNLPFKAEADIVILDPPCTSTGAFGKTPSAKWRLTQRSIERMSAIQWQIINNCAEKVKKGGVLAYSTCSITVEENEMIIERFLKWHPDFALEEINPQMGLPGFRGLTKCQRLYPHIHHCTGFFIAKLRKT